MSSFGRSTSMPRWAATATMPQSGAAAAAGQHGSSTPTTSVHGHNTSDFSKTAASTSDKGNLMQRATRKIAKRLFGGAPPAWLASTSGGKSTAASAAAFDKAAAVVAAADRHFAALTASESGVWRGYNREGLYRVPGSTKEVEEVYASITAPNSDHCFPDRCSEETVASVVKRVLQRLPEPVVPAAQRDSFLAAGTSPDRSARVHYIKLLIQHLPPSNIHLLSVLVRHIRTVASHCAANKMAPQALSIVFGPTVLRPAETGSMEAMMQAPAGNRVLQLIIEEADALGLMSDDDVDAFESSSNGAAGENGQPPQQQQFTMTSPPGHGGLAGSGLGLAGKSSPAIVVGGGGGRPTSGYPGTETTTSSAAPAKQGGQYGGATSTTTTTTTTSGRAHTTGRVDTTGSVGSYHTDDDDDHTADAGGRSNAQIAAAAAGAAVGAAHIGHVSTTSSYGTGSGSGGVAASGRQLPERHLPDRPAPPARPLPAPTPVTPAREAIRSKSDSELAAAQALLARSTTSPVALPLSPGAPGSSGVTGGQAIHTHTRGAASSRGFPIAVGSTVMSAAKRSPSTGGSGMLSPSSSAAAAAASGIRSPERIRQRAAQSQMSVGPLPSPPSRSQQVLGGQGGALASPPPGTRRASVPESAHAMTAVSGSAKSARALPTAATSAAGAVANGDGGGVDLSDRSDLHPYLQAGSSSQPQQQADEDAYSRPSTGSGTSGGSRGSDGVAGGDNVHAANLQRGPTTGMAGPAAASALAGAAIGNTCRETREQGTSPIRHGENRCSSCASLQSRIGGLEEEIAVLRARIESQAAVAAASAAAVEVPDRLRLPVLPLQQTGLVHEPHKPSPRSYASVVAAGRSTPDNGGGDGSGSARGFSGRRASGAAGPDPSSTSATPGLAMLRSPDGGAQLSARAFAVTHPGSYTGGVPFATAITSTSEMTQAAGSAGLAVDTKPEGKEDSAECLEGYGEVPPTTGTSASTSSSITNGAPPSSNASAAGSPPASLPSPGSDDMMSAVSSGDQQLHGEKARQQSSAGNASTGPSPRVLNPAAFGRAMLMVPAGLIAELSQRATGMTSSSRGAAAAAAGTGQSPAIPKRPPPSARQEEVVDSIRRLRSGSEEALGRGSLDDGVDRTAGVAGGRSRSHSTAAAAETKSDGDSHAVVRKAKPRHRRRSTGKTADSDGGRDATTPGAYVGLGREHADSKASDDSDWTQPPTARSEV